ncbi:MAG: hypothetical protein C5S43_00025 [Candidatus Methanocomedens sp.]|nr:MAG: hypothetical protein C5S43_00025 [ANME-2 cluster archaeon]
MRYLVHEFILTHLGYLMRGMALHTAWIFCAFGICPKGMITFKVGIIDALVTSATGLLNIFRMNRGSFIVHFKLHVRGVTIGANCANS